jgi:hypothetical protein
METRYYLPIDGQVSGPHSLTALKEMASVRAFNADTLIVAEGAETWVPLHTLPDLCAQLFPTGTAYSLKNAPPRARAEAGPPIVVEEILHKNLANQTVHEAPLDPVDHRPNRRRRDFLLLFAAGNLVALTAFLLMPRDPIVMVPLGSFFVLFNIGVYWVFYHVMDRY